MPNAVPMVGLNHVDGVFNYPADPTQPPASHVNSDRSKPLERPIRSKHTIPVYNGRDVQDQLSLDVHGLMLSKRETHASNFHDSEEKKSTLQRLCPVAQRYGRCLKSRGV